jgi:hypothetical protein
MLRAEVSQRDTYEVLQHQFLSFDVEKLLAKVIHQELKFVRKQEVLRQQVSRLPRGQEVEWLFYQVTQGDSIHAVIDRATLKKFLLLSSYLPNDNLVLAIIRRVDVDGDAKINFMEFSDILKVSHSTLAKNPLAVRASHQPPVKKVTSPLRLTHSPRIPTPEPMPAPSEIAPSEFKISEVNRE